MTYRAGFGAGMARFGFEPGPPRIECDSCGLRREVKGPIAPVWFLDGEAPPGWNKTGDGVDRKDLCPQCK